MSNAASEVAAIVDNLLSSARNLDVRLRDGTDALLEAPTWDGQNTVAVRTNDGRSFVIKVEQV